MSTKQDRIAGVKLAMQRNYDKSIEQTKLKPVKRNKAPEKLVEKEVCIWLKENSFSYNVIEAAGGMNKYGAITVKSGYPDISGNDIYGFAIYIELKARGKRHTLRENQREFLINKIRTNSFACVVDDVLVLESIYKEWIRFKKNNLMNSACNLLIRSLPVKRGGNNVVGNTEIF